MYGDCTEAWPGDHPYWPAWEEGGSQSGEFMSREFLLSCSFVTITLALAPLAHWITVHCPAPQAGNYSAHDGTHGESFPARQFANCFAVRLFNFNCFAQALDWPGSC